MAQELAAETQPWAGHFLLRATEFSLLLPRLPWASIERALELGCGNAFASALLSQLVRSVVATDLPDRAPSSHSVGLGAPRALLDRLKIDNCALMGATATSLPFRSESFDLVISFYVLEHITLADRRKVFDEMRRVLRPGGRAVAFVPNDVERVYSPLALALYLMSRVAARIRLPNRRARSAGTPCISAARGFRQNYPHFPVPEPHGAYRDSFEEWREHHPEKWRRYLEDAGLVIEDVSYSMLVPLTSAAPILGESAFHLYRGISRIDGQVGRTWIGRYLGQYACFVARRA